MPKNFRRRRAASADSDEEAQETSAVLEEVRIRQGMRVKRNGLDARKTVQNPETAGENEEEDVEEVALEKTFAQQTGKTKVDDLMEQYIQDKMNERRGLKKDTKQATQDAWQAQQDELYKIPEYLQVKEKEEVEGALLSEGIAEVTLPIEYKLKNIEETERAQRELASKVRQERPHEPSGYVPGNFAANYQHHRREWAISHRRNASESERRRAGEQLYNQTLKIADRPPGEQAEQTNRAGRPRRMAQATDQMVMERFKKRMRR